MNKHNPDVLSCLANLSNDEVFTPPEIVNKMLDMLPQELFESSETTFLDPCCKTGVFLREIAKRLLKNQMPGYEKVIESINQKAENDEELSTDDVCFKKELQQTIDHIFHKQLFGIAITEMTSLVSRRSVYCSKSPNYKYSISHFDNAEGNIRFKRINHTWVNGKCKFCGANEEQYSRGDSLETHAYEWIHTENPEGIFNMKFDVIISNPPYQLSDGGGAQTESSSGSAIPLYQKFVQQSKKLKPRYLSMIIPARWFSGGRNLDEFRDEMLNEGKLSKLVDFSDSRECFPGVDIAGGVCYFLWERDYKGICLVVNSFKNQEFISKRFLNEFPVFVRYAPAVEIIHKVSMYTNTFMDQIVYSSKPFGFRSFEEGLKKSFKGAISLYGSKGISYVKRIDVRTNSNLIDLWKVIMSKASAEHAGQTDKEGRKRIVSKIEVLPPGMICSESYLLLGTFDNKSCACNLKNYIKTNFVRFLLSTILLTQNIAKDKFCFVPLQDFSKPWTDEELYKKYKFTQEEIDFIESMIRPMEKETA